MCFKRVAQVIELEDETHKRTLVRRFQIMTTNITYRIVNGCLLKEVLSVSLKTSIN